VASSLVHKPLLDGVAIRRWGTVADAARRAADELAGEDHPQLRQLHADLLDLEARLRHRS
jgi:hypothetical protein